MLGRFKKWVAPQGGVAFSVEIEALVKAYGEFWRAFDKSFASALSSLRQYASGDDRLEVWGGLIQQGKTTDYMVLLTGLALSSDVVGGFYGQLRQMLPDGALIFAGSPVFLPPLLPIYAITGGSVFRCAVTEDGSSPTLRVLLSSPAGPVVGHIPAVPVNLAAMLEKIPEVSLLVADLSPEGSTEGFTEDGDRIAPEAVSSPKVEAVQAADDVVVEAVVIPPDDDEPKEPEPPLPLGSIIPIEAPMSPSGSLNVLESDVVSVRDASEEAPAEEPSEAQVEREVEAFLQQETVVMPDSMEVPTTVRASSQGDGVSTLIDIDDGDIASARVVSGAALNALSDGELRLILTSAPLHETCQKLAAALNRSPEEIARVYALASGAPAAPGPESTFALRARTVAHVVGWVLAPK